MSPVFHAGLHVFWLAWLRSRKPCSRSNTRPTGVRLSPRPSWVGIHRRSFSGLLVAFPLLPRNWCFWGQVSSIKIAQIALVESYPDSIVSSTLVICCQFCLVFTPSTVISTQRNHCTPSVRPDYSSFVNAVLGTNYLVTNCVNVRKKTKTFANQEVYNTTFFNNGSMSFCAGTYSIMPLYTGSIDQT